MRKFIFKKFEYSAGKNWHVYAYEEGDVFARLVSRRRTYFYAKAWTKITGLQQRMEDFVRYAHGSNKVDAIEVPKFVPLSIPIK